MVKTVLLVPKANNDGRAFGPGVWGQLEERLLRWGGLSREADVDGWWVSDGKTYSDRSRRYVVALPSWRDLAAWLEVVDWARVAFGQHAMFVEVAGIPEVLGASE